ncbi:MAG: hypothetical protein KAT58_06055 [candidate division Zixibacteria bacterium]|nr:hypothetical protein [candidate division Zixibacteria bacterium]
MISTEHDLIVNTHDRGTDLIAQLQKDGLKLSFVQLKYANFMIGDRIAVIYRTASEFAADLKSKMLYRTLVSFKREYSEPLYIVEGDYLATNGAPPPAIRSGITHITAIGRIPIIFSTDTAESAKYINLLVKQAEFLSPAKPRKSEPEEDDQQPVPYQLQMLAGLPEVSMPIALRLMKRFGSLKGVFSAKVTDLQKIKGLGPKKAQKMIKAIAAELEKVGR